MSDTDKLLRAFIEASGYEITSTPTKLTRERREFLEKENMLLCLAVEETAVDYKVTKKPVDHWDYCSVEPEFSKEDRIMFLQKAIDKLLKEDE